MSTPTKMTDRNRFFFQIHLLSNLLLKTSLTIFQRHLKINNKHALLIDKEPLDKINLNLEIY